MLYSFFQHPWLAGILRTVKGELVHKQQHRKDINSGTIFKVHGSCLDPLAKIYKPLVGCTYLEIGNYPPKAPQALFETPRNTV